MTATIALTWTCEECGAPVGDGSGYLTVSLNAVDELRRAREEWEQSNIRRTPGGVFGSYNAEALLTWPAAVRWQVLHVRCDPRPDEDYCYWIAVERIRTLAAVLDLTAHLLEKSWLQETDYDDLLRRIAADLTKEEKR